MHLSARAKVSMTASAFLLPYPAALRTAFGIVGETLIGEELLLISSKGEARPTIGALQFPIGETHWMTSFLKNCELNFGQPILEKPCLGETSDRGAQRGC